MQITVNGDNVEIAENANVPILLESLGVTPENAIVTLNGSVLSSADMNSPLKEGDSIELFAFVGGG